MSKLDGMQLQGIRSFAPNKPQSITFLSPLTLILGDNGSGKTTLIEALKYATTGVTPSGTDGGRSFIHDPKLYNEHKIKGQVKLRIFDITGKQVTVVRTMEGTQLPNNKIKFQTLDGTISRVGADGKPYSISSKCADINADIVSTLGVSKAILNNVIFCHQDDSNWPLDEAKKVKEKFDDIFNATRYIKCQDLFHKQVKEIQGELKLKQLDLKHLEEKKNEARSKRDELERRKARLAANESDVKKYEDQAETLEEKKKQLEADWRKVDKLETELKNHQYRKSSLEQQMKNMEDSLQEKFVGSDEELKVAIENFAAEKRTQGVKLTEKEEEVRNLDSEIRQMQKERQDISTKIGKLLSEQENHFQRIETRDENVRDMAPEIGLTGLPGGRLSDSDVDSAFSKLAQVARQKKDGWSKLKFDWDVSEKKLRDEHNKFRDQYMKMKDSIQSKEEQVKNNRREIVLVENELSALESAPGRLQKLETSLSEAKTQLSDAENAVNLVELAKKLKQSQLERDQLESELTVLRNEQMKLHKLSNKRAQLELLERNLESKKAELRKFKGRLEEKLNHLLTTVPETNLKFHFEAHLTGLKSEIAEHRAQEADKMQKITKLTTELSHTKSSLLQKEAELRSLKDKLFEKCRSQSLDQEIAKISAEVAELQNRRGSYTGSEHIYNRYLQSLRNAVVATEAEACCPLCVRPFAQISEAKELIEEIEHNLSQLPQKKRDCEKDLQEKQIRHETLLKLQPVNEQITQLNQEIPGLKLKCENQEKQLSELHEALDDISMALQCACSDESIGREIQGDVHTLDMVTKDVKKLEQEVDEERARLGGTLAGLRGIEEVETELRTAEAKYAELKTLCEKESRVLDDHKNTIAKLKEKVNHITSEKLKSSEALQQRSNLEKKRNDLKALNTDLRVEVEAAEDGLIPLLADMNASDKALKEGLVSKEKELEAARVKVGTLQRTQEEWTKLEAEIKDWVASGKAAMLDREQERSSLLDLELKNKEEKRGRFLSIVDVLKSSIIKQDMEGRNLKDNETLRFLERDLKTLNAEIAVLQAKIAAASITKIQTELKAIQDKIGSLERQIAQLQGAQTELRGSVRNLEVELNKRDFKEADERYRKQFIDCKTTEVAAEDLKKYVKALEYAVLHFHQERMKAINIILRRLWANTYRGDDIDYIEVQTDELTTSTSTDKRRSYNYRVIMVKRGVPMDMRGRCSAGQKVLASLLIRMALAETFSTQCGVLALDEPTTNLDKANIDSLIDTLIDIARRYANRKNFQLIVITHDENFVERMTREAGCERYFRVARKEGVSHIRACSVDVVEEETH